MLKKKKLIIFDLDGVLIDSILNMKFALKMTSMSLNIRLDFKLYKKYLGLPFEKIMNKLGIKQNIERIKSKYSFFSTKNISKIKINKKNLLHLKNLNKDYDLAVFTSKDRARTNIILRRYKIFKYIITSDDVKKGKPHPEGVLKILRKNKSKKKDSIYIGDSIYDYKAAKNSKISYLHAKWGYEKNLKKKYKINEISNFLMIKKYF
ncbi:HAD family hydrolase [Candidatus Pelagibacter sp.]|nr:HAD family hydrolase [Candidatus Pelagibacter sp.]